MRWIILAILLVCLPLMAQAAVNLPSPDWSASGSAPTAPGDAYNVYCNGSAPVGNAPVISEWTRTAKPDESFTLTGVRLTDKAGAQAGSDTIVWLWADNGSGGILRQCKVWKIYDDNILTATVPSDVPFGMYLVWVENQNGPSRPVAINKTQAEWIGPLGPYAAAGSSKRVFGKNLSTSHGTSTSYVYIQPAAGGSFTACTVGTVEPGAVTFAVPGGTASGSYKVYVHSGHGGQYGWSDPLDLTVQSDWVRGNGVVNLSPSGGNDTTPLQNAINTVSGYANGGTVQLAAGTFNIQGNISLKNNVKLAGAGRASTTLAYSSGFFGLSNLGANHLTIQDLAFMPASAFSLSIRSESVSGGSYNNDVLLRNVDFNINSDTSSNVGFYFMVDRFEVDNCKFYGSLTGDGRDWWVHGNELHGGRPWPEASISLAQGNTAPHGRYVIETNSASTLNWPAGPSGNYYYWDWLTSDQFNQLCWCPRLINWSMQAESFENTYVSHNSTTDCAIIDNRGEQILMHSCEASLYCQVSSNSGRTLTIRTDGSIDGDPNFRITNSGSIVCAPMTSVPTNMANGQVDNKAYVIITSGTGIGQARKIVSHTSTTITVDSDWRVQPASDSHIMIDYLYRNHQMYQNTLRGFPSGYVNKSVTASCGVDFDANCFQCTAEGNSLIRTEAGDNLGGAMLAPTYWTEVRGDTCTSTFSTGHKIRASSGYGWYSQYGASLGPLCLGDFYRGGSSTGGFVTADIADVYTSNYRHIVGCAVEGVSISGAGISSGNLDDTLYRNNTVTLTGSATSVTLQKNSQATFDGNTYSGGGTRYSWLGAPFIKINTGDTGDGSINGYLIDQYYTGGSTGTEAGTPDLSIDPLPNIWIVKYYRHGSSFSYTIPGLIANNSYKIRLHFVEPTYTSANQRKFSITGNGTTLVANYDIWAEVGKDKAVYHDYDVTSNSAGQITVAFTGGTGEALVCALEVTDNCNWKDNPNPLQKSAYFKGLVGQSFPPVYIKLANTGIASSTWSVNSSDSWITASVQAGGTNPAESETGVLKVAINSAGLSAGVTNGTVTLTTATGKTFYVGVKADLAAAATGTYYDILQGLYSNITQTTDWHGVLLSQSGNNNYWYRTAAGPYPWTGTHGSSYVWPTNLSDYGLMGLEHSGVNGNAAFGWCGATTASGQDETKGLLCNSDESCERVWNTTPVSTVAFRNGWNSSYFNLNTVEWKAAGPGSVSAQYVAYSASNNSGAEFQLGHYRNGTWWQNLNWVSVIGSTNTGAGNGLPFGVTDLTVQVGDSIVLTSRSANYSLYGTRQDNAAVSGGILFTPAAPADAPTFAPGAGTYTGSTTVTISSTTTAANIRYTTDGTTPSRTVGTVYSAPVAIAANCTLRAVAYRVDLSDSTVTSGVYTIKCAAPAFSPAAGTYVSAQAVSISSATGGVSIRYTLDGTTPTSTTGTVYSGPVSVSSTCTLKAIAYKTGMSDSDVTSGYYTIMTDTPLTTGLVLSLRADYGVSTNGSNVTSWYDGSGNNYSATPSTGTPTYNASGMNGKPTVDLTSTNVLGGTFGLSNDDWTVIMVMNYTGLGNLFRMNGLTGLGGYLDQGFSNYGDNNHWLYCGARYGNDNSYGIVCGTGSAYIVSLKFDGTYTTLYRNGATGGSATVGGSNRNKNSGVGGSFSSYAILGGAMNVGEFLVYDHALTNTELNQVHDFLGTKYNISVTHQ